MTATPVVTDVELWPTHSVSLTLQSDANGGIVFENEPDESIVIELLPFHKGNDGDVIDSGIATSLQQQISSNQQQLSVEPVTARFNLARSM